MILTKKVKILILVVFLLMFGVYFAVNIAPGSYANAEVYIIASSKDSIINQVHTFKINNPQYSLPETSILRDGNKSHWYHFYFRMNSVGRIFHTWVRPTGLDRCEFALVGAQDSHGDWTIINGKYTNALENEKLKSIFVDSILTRLQLSRE